MLEQLLAIALILAVVALAVVAIPIGRGPVPIRGGRPDPRGWRGFIYNNPDDPRLFVPRRLGNGWTLNLGHRRARPLLISVAAVTALCVSLGPLLSRP